MGEEEAMRRRTFKLTIEFSREKDGRWIATVLEMPGVLAYGRTRSSALHNVTDIAADVLATR
mgnify:CR=1 FL=1